MESCNHSISNHMPHPLDYPNLSSCRNLRAYGAARHKDVIRTVSFTVIAAFTCVLFPLSGADESSAKDRIGNSRIAPIPLRLTATGHLEVEVGINGHRANFLVDTGSPRTVVDRKASSRLEIPSGVPGQTAQGLGSSAFPTEFSSVHTFSLGPILLKNEQVILMDLSVVNAGQSADKQIDGIIGADFLAKYKAVLDYGKMILSLRMP